MRNIEISAAKDGTLTITIHAGTAACSAAPLSASGKTRVFATTAGNQNVTLADGRVVTIGINAYTKA